jgi:hypothetical protein
MFCQRRTAPSSPLIQAVTFQQAESESHRGVMGPLTWLKAETLAGYHAVERTVVIT